MALDGEGIATLVAELLNKQQLPQSVIARTHAWSVLAGATRASSSLRHRLLLLVTPALQRLMPLALNCCQGMASWKRLLQGIDSSVVEWLSNANWKQSFKAP